MCGDKRYWARQIYYELLSDAMIIIKQCPNKELPLQTWVRFPEIQELWDAADILEKKYKIKEYEEGIEQ